MKARPEHKVRWWKKIFTLMSSTFLSKDDDADPSGRYVRGRMNSPGLGWFIFLSSVAFVALIGGSLGGFFVSALGWWFIPTWFGIITGGAIALSGFSGLVPEFFVRTRQNGKFVATSPYVGLFPWLSGKSNSIVFPEGTVVATVPFLGREERGNVSMEVNTIPINFSAPGKVTELFFDGVLVYKTNPDKTPGFIAISEKTLATATINKIVSKVADSVRNMTFDEAKAEREKINTDLLEIFSKKKEVGGASGKGDTESDFEAEYCIIVKDVRISQVNTSPKVQKTRDGRAEAEEMFKSAAALLGLSQEEVARRIDKNEMTQGQLMDLMNILLGKSGEGHVHTHSFRLGGTEGLEKALVELFNRRKGV